MHRCRPRSLARDLENIISSALYYGYTHKPFFNIALCDPGDPKFEQLERMGMLKFVHEIPDFRRYRITERGAAAVGMELPEE